MHRLNLLSVQNLKGRELASEVALEIFGLGGAHQWVVLDKELLEHFNILDGVKGTKVWDLGRVRKVFFKKKKNRKGE